MGGLTRGSTVGAPGRRAHDDFCLQTDAMAEKSDHVHKQPDPEPHQGTQAVSYWREEAE